MRSHAARSRWPAVLVTLAVVAGACTPELGPPPGATTAGGGIGVPTAPADTVDPNGQLVTNLGREPETVDPHKASLLHEVDVITNVFENLMVLDPVTLAPSPGAASAPPIISADGRTHTFTLRDGLKFSDGTPLTARDFAYGYGRTCDPTTQGRQSFVLHVIAGCAEWNAMDLARTTESERAAARAKLGIRALDDKRIEFTTTTPAPYFSVITTLWTGMPVRQTDVETGGARWTEPATYIGNGPFKLTEWKHNESMTFERNEHYRLPVKLKSWRYVMISDRSVEFAAYRNNELDIALVDTQHMRAISADALLKTQVVDVPGRCTFAFAFNATKPPFDEPKVRMAFAKSFDRTAFVDSVLAGLGRPAEAGFIPFGHPGHDASDKTTAYDVSTAKRLLSESAYRSAAGLPRITYSFWSVAANTHRAEWVRQQWKANLGVEIALDPIDNPTYQQLIRDPTTAPQIFLFGRCATLPHQLNWLSTAWTTGSVLAHPAGYSSLDFDRAVREADGLLDQTAARDLYLLAARILSRDAPAAWIYYDASKVLIKPWTKGLRVTSMGVTSLSKHEIFITRH